MTERRRRTRTVAREGGPPRPSPRGLRRDPGRAGGFTLVELLVVMVIISILLGLILNAAMDSVKRAQERATQALITKLEAGLNDRLDALLQTRPDPNAAHLAMAAVYNSSYTDSNGNIIPIPGYLRAQVIAWYDFVKNELPDTFFVQNTSGPYPLNFASNPFPYSTKPATTDYCSPLNYYSSNSALALTSTGIFGASYPVAAGVYKNLGYQLAGYDGVDNNHNGLIDEYAEGAPDTTTQDTVTAHLNNHKHITARAEMLYAVLVEGRGPLGSVFNADEFTEKEVMDTDGDGLPEFVDAWGHPLQFFRWPILYHSDIQIGQLFQQTNITNSSDSRLNTSWSFYPPYATVMAQREQDPLDRNQQLVAPAWWSNSSTNPNANDSSAAALGTYPNPVLTASNDPTGSPSGAVRAFEYYFHRLSDPYPNAGGSNFWDRGATYGYRRAFFSKFLIVSGGLDEEVGVFIYPESVVSSGLTAWALIANENNAMPFGTDFVDFTSSATLPAAPSGASYPTIWYNPYTDMNDPANPTSADLLQAAQDDISNHNIQSTLGIGGGQ